MHVSCHYEHSIWEIRVEELTPIDGILGYNNNATRALFEEAKQLLEGADVQTEPLEDTEGEK